MNWFQSYCTRLTVNSRQYLKNTPKTQIADHFLLSRKLVDRPISTVTALIHFRRLEEVGQAVSDLLPLTPMALEVMDTNTLDLIGRAAHGIPADADATLLAEFDGGLGQGHFTTESTGNTETSARA